MKNQDLRQKIFTQLQKRAKQAFLILFLFSSSSLFAGADWTGNIDSNWNNGANWKDGEIPSNGDDIKIQEDCDHYPILSGTHSFKEIIIEENAQFTFLSGTLTIEEKIEVKEGGKFTQIDGSIKSDELKIEEQSVVTITYGNFNIDDKLEIKETGILKLNEGTLSADEIKIDKGEIIQSGGEIKTESLELDEGTYTQTDGNLKVSEIEADGSDNKFASTGGTVTFTGDGSDCDFKNADIQFHNVVIEDGADPNFDKSGGKVNIYISGDYTNENPDLNITKATFIFNGTGDQSVSSSSEDGNSTFGKMEIDKPSGVVNIVSNIEIKKTLNDPSDLLIDNNNLVIVGGEVLPVELTIFKAELIEEDVHIIWETATEVNNYGFEVERKLTDLGMFHGTSNDWQTIAFIQGHGNSNSPKSYSYIDKDISLSGIYKYRLRQIDNDGAFEIFEEVEVKIDDPEEILLKQNHPNPFNPSTKISFALPKAMNVSLKIYDILGREIKTLLNGKLNPGNHSIKYDASNLTSGVYLYQLITEDFISTKKMNLLK